MKRSIFIVAILIFNNAYSQSTTNNKLVEVYGEKITNKLLQNNQNKQIYFDVILNNSFEVLENYSCKECTDIISLDQFEEILKENPSSKIIKEVDSEYFLSTEFNILRFSVKRDIKEFIYYRIGNSGYSLKLMPTSKITELYNSKLKKSN